MYTATNPTDPTSASFKATATGDLNGNTSTTSVWTYEGAIITPGVMRLATTIQEPADPEE